MGEAPTLVGYLTMAMKITPNLERALSFASGQPEGRMGQELRDALSENNLRLHSGAEEALSEFARRWEKPCPELKQSVRLILNSGNERPEARGQSLDRAFELVLEGARQRMLDFASSLHMPTLLIYSMGVLLPLVLIVTLPVLLVVDVSLGIVQISAIYCFLLPALVYTLSKRVLSKRPVTLRSPKIPGEPAGLKQFALATILSLPPPLLALSLGAPGDLMALATLGGLTLGITTYLYLISAPSFRLREQSIRMENEFCDALVQLGNLTSERRPPEDALMRAASSMRGGELGEVFLRASVNIKLGGMGLRAALFDEEKGALRKVHSRMITGTMKIFVDLIERSTRAAGEAIMRVGEHLRDLKEAEIEIRRSMGEMVTSMRSVALFFAPLVTSIAARMQEMLSSKTAATGFLGSSEISPSIFLFVLGIYILLLTPILINYAVEIELGDDRLAKRMAIAGALPIAMGVFTAGAILGGQMLSSIVG